MPMFSRISPWIACLALLLNMLAMPLSRAMQAPDSGLMLWGGFCSSHALPPGFDKLVVPFKSAPASGEMKHGDCCCGHAGLAALPSSHYRHFLPRYAPDIVLDDPLLPALHPRIRWPSLSPRASPVT
ncbi:DUF2946 family protein [Pseudomonas trivialis]|uniref:DUF2946 family protein n=1 Tax=Pseudomonas trivialis TaxID=200450 RepID=UPI0030D0FA10